MNPTGQPMGTPMPSAPSGAAKDAVNLPSLFIIILGALGGVMFLFSMVSDQSGMSQKMLEGYMQNLPPDQQELMAKLMSQSRSGGMFSTILGLVLSGLVVFAGLQMRALKNWGLALAGAILVMIPCSTNCCCCLGIPIGIWALITLTKPEVKSAFS